jgi:hypothetical protein
VALRPARRCISSRHRADDHDRRGGAAREGLRSCCVGVWRTGLAATTALALLVGLQGNDVADAYHSYFSPTLGGWSHLLQNMTPQRARQQQARSSSIAVDPGGHAEFVSQTVRATVVATPVASVFMVAPA